MTTTAKIRQKSTEERVGFIVTIASTVAIGFGVVAAVITGVIGFSVSPDPLLEERPPLQSDTRGATVEIPTQEWTEQIHIHVGKKDATRAGRSLDHMAAKWGGHRVRTLERTSARVYALPESGAQWLSGLDSARDQNAYSALNDPPDISPQTGGPMTAVRVKTTFDMVPRRIVANLLWAWGATVVAGAIGLGAGIAMVTPNQWP